MLSSDWMIAFMLSSGRTIIFSFSFAVIFCLDDYIGVIIWLYDDIDIIICLDDNILIFVWRSHLLDVIVIVWMTTFFPKPSRTQRELKNPATVPTA
jgi:hypothetical protein